MALAHPPYMEWLFDAEPAVIISLCYINIHDHPTSRTRIEMSDIVWIVPGYLKHTWGSLG